jgi:hypothetical protein
MLLAYCTIGYCIAAMTDSLARQPCPAALPGSLARQPCPAALPGSLAWQPYPAALRGSLTWHPCGNIACLITGCKLFNGRQFSSSFPRN